MRDRLIARIASEGPLPFEEFMRLSLYDPAEGYFAASTLRSAETGDFLTSPEVSPLFGETLAVLVADEARRIGVEAAAVVEAGAGSGSLLRPLLDSLEQVGEVWAVEVSPPARASLAERVPEARVVERIEEVPTGLRGVVLANELLDNLPAALAVRRGSRWHEQVVGIEDGEPALVEVSARPEVAAWAESFGGPVPDGGRVEVQIEACEWIGRALGLLEAGALVVIDYGDTAEALRPRRAEGTLRTYRSHHLGPDPLLEPGAVDITMDVNFTAVLATAERAGAVTEMHRQDDLLSDLGLRARLRDLRHRELELAKSGDSMARLEARSAITGGETLLHPRGLGDFRVLTAHKG